MIDRNVRHRFFNVIRLLFEETDEDNALSVAQIMERIAIKYGTTYKIERRAIYKDLDTLAECGIPIEVRTERSNKKFYFWRNKPFERHELQLLIHAVHSARFLSQADSEALTYKLRTLSGKWDVAKQAERVRLADRVKTVFGSLRDVLRTVNAASDQTRKLFFQYGKWNADKQFELRHDGKIYQVAPYAVVWVNDFFYLIGIPEGEERFKHYRLDRMREVKLGKSFRMKEFQLAQYVKQAFQMFGGPVQPVVLRVEEGLIPVIFDRLGLDVKLVTVEEQANNVSLAEYIDAAQVAFSGELVFDVREDGDEDDDQAVERPGNGQAVKCYDVHFDAAISEGLVRWILSLGPQAEVIEPQALRSGVSEMISVLSGKYQK